MRLTKFGHSCLLVEEGGARVLLDPGSFSEGFETLEGLTAVCVQHEMDHLLGKVFVEYLSPLKRDRIRTKMLKKTRDELRGK